MQKSSKNTQKRKTLGEAMFNALFPRKYCPPPRRVAPPLVIWSGLPTDQPPPNPYAWGQGQPQRF